MTQHKHHDSIVAWAKGATVQYRDPSTSSEWTTLGPNAVIGWYDHLEYRIKPEPKPDRVSTYQVEWKENTLSPKWHQKALCNLELTFDGETGELKKAGVI